MKRTMKTMHEKKHNILTRTHYITCLIALVVALALAGCGKHTPKAPPKQMVQDAVAIILPPFLSLDSIELEPISTDPEAVKVNFKAIVAPKEDLYQVDHEVEGTPKVTLLKVVQAAGTKVSLYGSVEAHRMMDKWTLELPQIQVNPNQFGNPRGTFDAQSFVIGSNEATAAIRQQAANAELQRQAKEAALKQQELEQKALLERQAREEKARLEREEQARIAFEEQRQKEIEQRKKDEEQRQKEGEADRQKLILATVAGTRYIGTITYGDKVQRLRLVFIEQEGTLIRAEASNPDRSKMSSPAAPAEPRRPGVKSSLAPQEKQTFVGELVYNPKPESGKPDVAYTIVMSPVGRQSGSPGRWEFYEDEGSLKLLLTDTGLEGEAQMGWGHSYTIRLQRSQ